MATVDESWMLFRRKAAFETQFTAGDERILFKQLESYEEYLEVRPLVEKLSRCKMLHSREYMESMLCLPSYYPFIVRLLDGDLSSAASPVNGLSSSAKVNGVSGSAESADPAPPSHRSKVIGYVEVYTLPHLGRLFDSRLERVVVDPDYRNRGICQSMVKIAIDFCKDVLHCNRIDLTADNPVAIHIYEKFGFERVQTSMFRLTLC